MCSHHQMGSIDDNTSGGSYAYRASKAALNIVNKSLSADLAGNNVQCTLLHPGCGHRHTCSISLSHRSLNLCLASLAGVATGWRLPCQPP